MNCPNEHGEMEKTRRIEEATFRGVVVRYEVELWTCSTCGIEVEDLPLAADNQRSLSEAYRQAAGLLTGKEIAAERKRLGWSQEDLARAINVGIASVKRWERGQIQTPVMDGVLRRAFEGDSLNQDPYTGNRPLSLGRIKLVLQRFGEHLKKDLLAKGDRLLYAAKHLWYADMVCYRETGRSITGATYAALPLGPQVNNYRELVELIRSADATAEEPLSDEEERIIRRVAMTFPTDKSAFAASHRESAWESKTNGMLIPYSDAQTLTEM